MIMKTTFFALNNLKININLKNDTIHLQFDPFLQRIKRKKVELYELLII